MERIVRNATASTHFATKKQANAIAHQGAWEINAKRFVLSVNRDLIVIAIVIAIITPHVNLSMECVIVPLDTQAENATNVAQRELMGIVVVTVALFAARTHVIT